MLSRYSINYRAGLLEENSKCIQIVSLLFYDFLRCKVIFVNILDVSLLF